MVKAIDIHMHPPLPSGYSTIGGRFMNLIAGMERRPGATPEAMYEKYEALDFFGVLCGIDDETLSGVPFTANDEIAGLVKRWPHRFGGFGSVDPHKGALAIKEINRCVDEFGFKGLKFHPSVQSFAMNDPKYDAMWKRCEELELVLLVHAGVTAVGKGFPGGGGIAHGYSRPIPYMDDVAARFPGLRIIMAHPARPWIDEQLELIVHKPNMFMDISGWMPQYFDPMVIQYANTIARGKVLFGSDYPMDVDRWLREFAELPVKADVRAEIMFHSSNAMLKLGLTYTGD
ncbi:MAG TPA: amidohydrolase family protein [Tepidiformaceae bacterium]|nr:amidohydrolase family protein [Tepidiformaceae bacterium]